MKKALLTVVLCLFALSATTYAIDYPTKNININVPYAAGGTTDLSTRALTDSIPSGVMPSGVSFVITNMPGGSGLVGTTNFSTARKDGYRLGIVNCDFLLNIVRGATQLKLEQFVPLAFIQADPYLVLVRNDAPYKTYQDLVNHMKANPDALKCADSGPGSVPHLAALAMMKAHKISMKTMGYDNSLEGTMAVVNGEADFVISHSSAASGQLKAGTVRPLACTSNERLTLFPDVPAIGELYPAEAGDMKVLSWIAVAALAGTPQERIDWLRDTFNKSAKTDAYKDKLKNFQMQDVSHFTADDMQKFFAEQAEYYKKQLQ